MQVAHINGIRDDNRPENLRWATLAENCADKWRHGTAQIADRNTNTKLKISDVREIRMLAKGGLSYRRIGEKFGVSKGAIQHVVRRMNWKHVP